MNSCPISSDAVIKSKERGHYESYVDTFAQVTVLKWNDNNVVRIGTNISGAELTSSVQRFSRKLNKHVQITRPAAVGIYNAAMGGADVLDGHVASYRISMKGKKWWWMHFVNTLDVIKSSSYSMYSISRDMPCHNAVGSDPKLSFLEFIRRIVIHYLRPSKGH